MSIDSWLKLQSELSDTLNRTDLVADISEYSPGTIEGSIIRGISKAERRIVRRLKTRIFETSTSVNTTGLETISLPSDFVMMKAALITSNPVVVLVQKDLTTLYNDHPSSVGSIPDSYSPYGTSLYLRPVPASVTTIKMFYYAQPPVLSSTNASNVLLTNYPDLLLYGALIEITAHIEDDARIGLWKQAFDEAIADITNDNTINRWGGAPIRSSVDIRGVI